MPINEKLSLIFRMAFLVYVSKTPKLIQNSQSCNKVKYLLGLQYVNNLLIIIHNTLSVFIHLFLIIILRDGYHTHFIVEELQRHLIFKIGIILSIRLDNMRMFHPELGP